MVIKQSETASPALCWTNDGRTKTPVEKMQLEAEKKGYKTLSVNNVVRHDKMESHITILKKILFDFTKPCNCLKLLEQYLLYINHNVL